MMNETNRERKINKYINKERKKEGRKGSEYLLQCEI
jgi:hypothetical protein